MNMTVSGNPFSTAQFGMAKKRSVLFGGNKKKDSLTTQGTFKQYFKNRLKAGKNKDIPNEFHWNDMQGWLKITSVQPGTVKANGKTEKRDDFYDVTVSNWFFPKQHQRGEKEIAVEAEQQYPFRYNPEDSIEEDKNLLEVVG